MYVVSVIYLERERGERGERERIRRFLYFYINLYIIVDGLKIVFVSNYVDIE